MEEGTVTNFTYSHLEVLNSRKTIDRTLAERKIDLKNAKAGGITLGNYFVIRQKVTWIPNGQETNNSAQGAHIIYSDIYQEPILPA